jgi:hypothetical protein
VIRRSGTGRSTPISHGIAIGGGSFLRAASIAARNVSDVRSSAVARSAQ